MSDLAEEMRATLERLEHDLERIRHRRSQRPTLPVAKPAPASPVHEAPFKPPPSWQRPLAVGAALAVAGTGLALDSRILLAAAFIALAGELIFASRRPSGDSARVEELARRVAALERRSASMTAGDASGLEEDIQEFRTILRSLMEALDPGARGTGQ